MVTKTENKEPDKVNKSTNYFTELSAVDCRDKIEKKNGLSYLSWAWAWYEVAKRYPAATYEIVKFDGIPYVYDEKTGYMVYTRVTIEGVTREMWLPVMDGNNRAMKNEPYKVVTKYGKEITVEAATMFDINKTVMRCLTKNLGMFGLGLSLYAGEDIFDEDDQKPAPAKAPTEAKQTETSAPKKPNKVREEFVNFCKENDIKGEEFNTICKIYKLNNAAPDDSFKNALEYAKTQVKKRIYAEALANSESNYAEALANEALGLGDYPEEV